MDGAELPYSKEKQVGRERYCTETGESLLRRNCTGPSCRGRRNRAKGKRGQRVARKALMLSDEQWAGRQANEETWTSALRIEVKAGGRMANPVGIRYDQTRAQSDEAKPIGDTRPFAAVFKPDGWSDVLLVVKGSDLPNVVEALLLEWGGSDE